jgi:hypothetical protein
MESRLGEESSIRDLSSNLFGNPPTTTEVVVVSLACLGRFEGWVLLLEMFALVVVFRVRQLGVVVVLNNEIAGVKYDGGEIEAVRGCAGQQYEN